ncbi:MAG: TM2 domain-containing protein [Clostridia bacterium]|nr:TM2 domain-containing protein [Clostridia bacterium]
MENTNEQVERVQEHEVATKFCSECGERINAKAVICPKCGCQVGQVAGAQAQPQIVINNANQNSNTNAAAAVNPNLTAKNKWIALILCWCFGYLGAHKFYEGKIFMGIIYFFTFGLLGIGCLVDFFAILFKSNPYYV